VTDRLAVSIVEDLGLVWGSEVILIVNDVPLRDLIPSSADEEWVGPPIGVLTAHPDHLLGGPDRWEDDTDPWYDDPAMLACTCGQPGCRAVLVQVEVTDEVVDWSAIRRAGSDESLAAGPFRFDRAQYEGVVTSIVEHVVRG
jgi:hypothetical protein